MVLKGEAIMKKTVFVCAMLLIATILHASGEKRYTVPLDGSPAHGSKNAAVTIVEFIDYQ